MLERSQHAGSCCVTCRRISSNRKMNREFDMDALPRWADERIDQDAVEEELWLLGQPPLYSYLSYVERTVIGGSSIPRSTIVDEWREANDYYYELEMGEAGIAD